MILSILSLFLIVFFQNLSFEMVYEEMFISIFFLTRNTLSVNASQTQITAVGTLTSGTWNATTIAVANGGTGSDNFK